MTAILARKLKLGCHGKDVQAFRIVGCELLGRPAPTAPEWYQRTFNLNMRQLVKDVQDDLGVLRSGVVGPATMEELRDADEAAGGELVSAKADRLFAEAYFQFSKPKRKVPALGPVYAGGKTVLEHDLTHATSGIDDYPAFDDAFAVGVPILAVEPMEVTRQSSSKPGDAFYAEGDSGILYWYGHLDTAPATGTRLKKGTRVGRTAPNHVGGGPHAHLGMDARPLCGFILEHHTNYTHGAPTVGRQLRKWAAAE